MAIVRKVVVQEYKTEASLFCINNGCCWESGCTGIQNQLIHCFFVLIMAVVKKVVVQEYKIDSFNAFSY